MYTSALEITGMLLLCAIGHPDGLAKMQLLLLNGVTSTYLLILCMHDIPDTACKTCQEVLRLIWWQVYLVASVSSGKYI